MNILINLERTESKFYSEITFGVGVFDKRSAFSLSPSSSKAAEWQVSYSI